MKKALFTAIKAICVGVMTLFAVSCYDDSALNSKLDNLSAEVQAMQAKLAELEKGLNEQASALAALDGKVGALKVETSESGLTTLTLADGSKLVVSANGVVTIVNEDGKEYWAVVDKDGAVKNLGVTVGHDLSFEVDPETFELLVNGVGTGAYVSVESAYVLGNVVETEDSVTLTVGDKTFTLAKKSATEFEIVSGKVYFEAGESKTLPVVVEGMKSAMLASGPKGWTAEVSGSSLTVTAPDVEMDGEFEVLAGDEKGIVEVWVLTVDGTVLSGKVAVAIDAAPVSVTYDPMNGIVTFTADYSSSENGEVGNFYGACAIDKFDIEKIFAFIESEVRITLTDDEYTPKFCTQNNEGNTVFVHPLEELLGEEPTPGTDYIIWSVAPEFEWIREGYYTVDCKCISNAEDFAKTYINYFVVEAEGTSISFNNVVVDVKVDGLEDFIAAYYNPAAFENFPIDMILAPGTIENAFGKNLYQALTEQVNHPMTYMPTTLFYGDFYKGLYQGALSDLYKGDAMSFVPGTTVSLLILPIIPGKNTDEYTVDDLFLYNYELLPLTLGSKATLNIGEATKTALDYFEVPFTTTGDVETVYYGILTKEGFEDAKNEYGEGTDNGLIQATFEYNWLVKGFEGTGNILTPFTVEGEAGYFDIMQENKIAPATEYVVYGYAVDSEGKCSELAVQSVVTSDVVFNDQLSVTAVGSASAETELASAEFTITGPAVKLYYCVEKTFFQSLDMSDATAVKAEIIKALTGEWKVSTDNINYNVGVLELNETNFVNGKVVINDFEAVGNAKERSILALVMDAEGRVSQLHKSATFTWNE